MKNACRVPGLVRAAGAEIVAWLKSERTRYGLTSAAAMAVLVLVLWAFLSHGKSGVIALLGTAVVAIALLPLLGAWLSAKSKPPPLPDPGQAARMRQAIREQAAAWNAVTTRQVAGSLLIGFAVFAFMLYGIGRRGQHGVFRTSPHVVDLMTPITALALLALGWWSWRHILAGARPRIAVKPLATVASLLSIPLTASLILGMLLIVSTPKAINQAIGEERVRMAEIVSEREYVGSCWGRGFKLRTLDGTRTVATCAPKGGCAVLKEGARVQAVFQESWFGSRYVRLKAEEKPCCPRLRASLGGYR